jgi:hypothetical protein
MVAGQPGLFNQIGIKSHNSGYADICISITQAKYMALGFFPGVKQLRHEDDHSPPPSSKVKDERSYTCTLPIHLHCMERGNFTFCQRSKHIYQSRLLTQTGMDTKRHWICGQFQNKAMYSPPSVWGYSVK